LQEIQEFQGNTGSTGNTGIQFLFACKSLHIFARFETQGCFHCHDLGHTTYFVHNVRINNGLIASIGREKEIRGENMQINIYTVLINKYKTRYQKPTGRIIASPRVEDRAHPLSP
jgi:hypothetical protein